MHLKKIFIIGTCGCGKTSLGKTLAEYLGIQQYDLDDYYWLPNWTPREDDEFQAILNELVSNDSWIITGNYFNRAKHLWSKGDIVLWLDCSLLTCLWRCTKRNLTRIYKNEPCCNGNYESLSHLIGRQGILWWVMRTYFRNKRHFKNNPMITRIKSLQQLNKILKLDVGIDKKTSIL